MSLRTSLYALLALLLSPPLGAEPFLQVEVNLSASWTPSLSPASQEPAVTFDIDADGDLDRISWTQADEDDAFLCLDRNQNGTIDNGTELFGYATPLLSGEPARLGYRALAELDRPETGGTATARSNRETACSNASASGTIAIATASARRTRSDPPRRPASPPWNSPTARQSNATALATSSGTSPIWR